MEKYKFQAKSKDDLLDKALQELNVKEDEVFTKFYEEKGGLFSGKKYTIEVVKLTDIAETGKDIILELLNALNIQSNVETKIRDKKIILLRYYKGKTQTEVAKILGITQVQVSRLEKRILNEMREKIIS